MHYKRLGQDEKNLTGHSVETKKFSLSYNSAADWPVHNPYPYAPLLIFDSKTDSKKFSNLSFVNTIMLFIRDRKPKLNTQSDSIRSKVFV